MMILIEVLLALLFTVCTGLFFLHKYDSEEISDLRDEIRQIRDEVSAHKSKLWIYEQKLIKISNDKDKIEIVHKYDDSGAPDYPNSNGGF